MKTCFSLHFKSKKCVAVIVFKQTSKAHELMQKFRYDVTNYRLALNTRCLYTETSLEWWKTIELQVLFNSTFKKLLYSQQLAIIPTCSLFA